MKSLNYFMTEFHKKINISNPSLLRNKTILITGASGLIGSNLIAYLNYLNKRYELNVKVTAIVRSGIEEWMTTSENVKYLQQDLSREKLPEDLKFDYLIHCATYGQPKKFLKYPKETVMLNINVLFDLLEMSQKNNATFMYLSSAEIYGQADEKHIPTEEDFFGYVNTLSERAIYSESKRLAETICYLYSKQVNVKIPRLLICYGPGVKYEDKRVYCEFIKKAHEFKEIVMMDEGLAERTLCFVTDAIEMLLNTLLNSKEIVYNICGIETITIKELAEIIAKINNAKVSSIIQKKIITGTPVKSALSNKKYVEEFKKKDFIKLTDGLKATSDWFKNLKDK